jgi:hypothetical protein
MTALVAAEPKWSPELSEEGGGYSIDKTDPIVGIYCLLYQIL